MWERAYKAVIFADGCSFFIYGGDKWETAIARYP